MKNTNTARKYYALHWRAGCAYEYEYDTIPELEISVATIVLFENKHSRDKYVDSYYCAESIPSSIARKLIKKGVEHTRYYKVGDDK